MKDAMDTATVAEEHAEMESASKKSRTPVETVPRFTDIFIRSLKLRPGERERWVAEYDPDLEGSGRHFQIRLSGMPGRLVKTFYYVGRIPGTSGTRHSIGRYGRITLQYARKTAEEWPELVEKGQNPKQKELERLEAEKRKKDAEARARANSFAAVAEEYIVRHVSKIRRSDIVSREIRAELVARWGTKQISEITSADLVKLVDDITDGLKANGTQRMKGGKPVKAPVQAARIYSHARALFNWAVGRDILDRSPCEKLKLSALTAKRKKRRRILSADELRAFWSATERLGYPYRPFFRMLALTGLRRREVAQARWCQFDLQQAIWVIPAAQMKMDVDFVVPLVPAAVKLLKALPHFSKGDFLFSTTEGQRPISGFSKTKRRLDELMTEELAKRHGSIIELEPWVIHDVRRSFRTNLSALPITGEIRERLLAHAQGELSDTYDRYSYLNEKRQGLELWTDRLFTMVKLDEALDAA
jgi:integrase